MMCPLILQLRVRTLRIFSSINVSSIQQVWQPIAILFNLDKFQTVDSVEIDIEVTVSNKSKNDKFIAFDIDPTWKYPELNVDPNGFNFYPNVDELLHIIGTEENIKVISKFKRSWDM